jgi:hypothetical protein
LALNLCYAITGSAAQPQQCGDSCSAMILGQNTQHKQPDSVKYYDIAHTRSEQRLEVRFLQHQELDHSSWYLRSIEAAKATVSLQLAACSEAGQTCIKLQLLQAWLRDVNVSADANAKVNQDNRSQRLEKCGAVLQDISIQFSAATVSQQDGGSSEIKWQGLSPVNPSLLVKCSKVQRQSTDDFYR